MNEQTTYKFTGTFMDYDGNILNPDDDEVKVEIYDQNKVVIVTGVGVKVSSGIYSYEYSPTLNAVPTLVYFTGKYAGKNIAGDVEFSPRKIG